VDLYRAQNINANNTFFGGGQLVFKQMGGDVVTLGPIRNVEKILPKLRQITFRARQQQGVHTNEVMY
jgi:tetrahydromethanopterin S-methyltransferase subunit H